VDEIPAQKLIEVLARLYQLVLVLDGDGHVVWLSNEMGALCADNASQLDHDARVIFPESLEFRREFAIRSQIRQQGFLSNMQTEVRDTRGEMIPVELSILPIGEDDLEKPLYIVIARLVGEDEPREKDPRRAARPLGAILDGAPEAVLAVNERGFITYANPAMPARSSSSCRRWRRARESTIRF
jgi:PAS domain-containing protein